VVGVLTVVMLIVERYVVTDQEAIRATLAEIARDVETNDPRKVTRHIASSNQPLVQRAQTEMPNYQFNDCRVTEVHKIDVDAGAEPRSAMVEFNVSVEGTFKQAGMEVSGTYPRWVRLHMVREDDGRWTVQNYEHDVPASFLFEQPGEGVP
jgi:hypothetical protein